jgi:hypothetical protein
VAQYERDQERKNLIIGEVGKLPQTEEADADKARSAYFMALLEQAVRALTEPDHFFEENLTDLAWLTVDERKALEALAVARSGTERLDNRAEVSGLERSRLLNSALATLHPTLSLALGREHTAGEKRAHNKLSALVGELRNDLEQRILMETAKGGVVLIPPKKKKEEEDEDDEGDVVTDDGQDDDADEESEGFFGRLANKVRRKKKTVAPEGDDE